MGLFPGSEFHDFPGFRIILRRGKDFPDPFRNAAELFHGQGVRLLHKRFAFFQGRGFVYVNTPIITAKGKRLR